MGLCTQWLVSYPPWHTWNSLSYIAITKTGLCTQWLVRYPPWHTWNSLSYIAITRTMGLCAQWLAGKLSTPTHVKHSVLYSHYKDDGSLYTVACINCPPRHTWNSVAYIGHYKDAGSVYTVACKLSTSTPMKQSILYIAYHSSDTCVIKSQINSSVCSTVYIGYELQLKHHGSAFMALYWRIHGSWETFHSFTITMTA